MKETVSVAQAVTAQEAVLPARVQEALGEAERANAARAVPWLLANPPSRQHLESILNALR